MRLAAAAVAWLCAGAPAPVAAACARGAWWDAARAACRACSRCAPALAVLRPCAVHRDTLCAPLGRLDIDWSWLGRLAKRRGDAGGSDRESLAASGEESASLSAPELAWNVQTSSLAVALFACLFFFVVVLVYSVYHARQWRRLKDNLEADVEGITAKLHLMLPTAEEVERKQTASGNARHYTNVASLSKEKLLGQDTMTRNIGPGNVYIQEKN